MARCHPDEGERLAEAVERSDLSLAPEAGPCFSQEEFKIAAAFKFRKRRRDWLAGRLAAKRAVAARLAAGGAERRLAEIEILNDPDGIPYFKVDGRTGEGAGSLSLSHSGGWGVAGAVPAGTRVGVDLEMVENRKDSFLSLIAHESELDPVTREDVREQTRLWTLKEAVAKVLGKGLSIGFHDVRFPADAEGTKRLELHGKAREHWLEMGEPAIDFDSEVGDHAVLSVAHSAARGKGHDDDG